MRPGPCAVALRQCSSGCERPIHARTLCVICYNRARRKGNLAPYAKRVKAEQLRLWLPADLWAEIRKLARSAGLTYSDQIRRLVLRGLGRVE